MNFESLINYIQTTPLTWLILTISSFKLGIILYNKSNKNIFLQPIIVAYLIILTIVSFTNTPFKEYFKSVEIIHFFLCSTTVSLSLPLYKNLKYIKSLFFPIFITLFFGSIFTISISVCILWFLDSNSLTILSMTTKSITAPIAIISSEQIGAIPSLAVGFVIITGIIGAVFGTTVFKIMRIKNDTSQGFALGLISHGIGTAKAVEISQRAAAFSALAMGLNGIFTAILLPFFINLF